MTPAARVQAAIEILDQIFGGQAAEQVLTGWARRSRFAGSKDRAAVRDHVFDALRQRRSAAAAGGGDTGRQVMTGVLRLAGADLKDIFTGTGYAPDALTPQEQSAGRAPQSEAEEFDLPDWLWPRFVRSLGHDGAVAAASALQRRAPVFLRVNLLKSTLTDAQNALQGEDIQTVACAVSPTALKVTSGTRKIRASKAFQTGLVELQDAASQAVVDALPITQGRRILDMCAGGGGKTLAIAARSNDVVYAYDAALRRLRDLPARADRAGAKVRLLDDLDQPDPFDLVLCDAPCSGSGAWARVPEGKWSLTQDRLEDIKASQAEILDRALTLVRPGGIVAYATCSYLAEENRGQIDTLLRKKPGWRLALERSWGAQQETDGFYSAHLTHA